MRPVHLLLPLLPIAIPASAGDSCKPKGCAAKSLSASLNLDAFAYRGSYTFTTPAHQNSNGYVNFNLTNSATGKTTACSGYSSQLTDFFYGNVWYDCGDGTTRFTFNKATGEVQVNSSWTCTGSVTNYIGTGATTLTLSCSEETYQNPNWTMGQIYSSREVTCSTPPTVINLQVEKE